MIHDRIVRHFTSRDRPIRTRVPGLLQRCFKQLPEMDRLRIGIVNIWHDDNRGDSAIAIATHDLLARTFPEAEIEFWSLADRSGLQQAHRVVSTQIDDVPIHPAPIAANQGRSTQGTYAVKTLGQTVRAIVGLRFPRLNPPSARALDGLDLVVASGGHYLYSAKGVRWALRMFRLVYPLLIAQQRGTPTALMGHSLGPFEGRFSRALARRVLTRTDAIYAREELSARTAVALGASASRVRVMPDPAFAIAVDDSGLNALLARHRLDRAKYWVVTVRKCLRGDRRHRVACSERFLGEMSQLIRAVLDGNFVERVALVPHVIGPTAIEDDRDPTADLAELLADRPEVVTIDEDFTPGTVAALYGAAELVVGTRFHSIILAMVGGSPAYAVSYFGPKAVGIMNMAEMSDACVEMEEFTAAGAIEWLEGVDLEGRRASTKALEARFKDELSRGFRDLRDLIA